VEKYKIYENNNGQCKLRKKGLFFWVWLDTCRVWDNWYGKRYPCIFNNREEAMKFINGDTYKTIINYP